MPDNQTPATKQDLLDLEPRIIKATSDMLGIFAQNMIKAFVIHETKLLREIEASEHRVTHRIETVGVSFRKLEVDVSSLTRRVEDLERFVQKPNA